ncbi:pleiotropic regulatory protein RsmS [Enterovibrio nigricans]|uniref:Primosomal protein n=1 Tax=Enterovibrio nigricans DSM 22720 TaxID=1121868 RepID=A0A1T4US69_9GAMM|nr:pleiotropic regulatory protein RsmS [Enterovibrio nigricans]PKF51015.1 primosomal protein [Enterovibrio nigricans]SKA55524.1 Protein of unknown function [Enterovibrio nigricans DSM 22720]
MTDHGLENALEDVKLAVDLIYLLESNEVDPRIALSALNMVKQDLERKIREDSPNSDSSSE